MLLSHSLDSFIGSGHFRAMSFHKFLQRLVLLRLQLGLLRVCWFWGNINNNNERFLFKFKLVIKY